MGTTVTTDGTQLDPKVVKVMQAIKQVESGGDYSNRTGDNGASAGAYQWNNDGKPLKPGELPSHWKSAAKGILGDENAPMTPANQNKVAYHQILNYKNQGLDPTEIDALWNGAHKDAATGKYVHNNPKRAQDFTNALMGNKGFVGGPQQQSNNFVTPPQPSTSAAPNEPAPQSEGLLSKIGHGASDILNSIESPFVGLAAAPVQGIAALMGRPDPYAKGIPGAAGGNVSVTPLDAEKKLGDAAQVGSYFVPGEGVLGASVMGALQGAGSAASQGGDVAQVATGAGLGGVIGGGTAGLTKLAGAGISKVGSLISGDSAAKATSQIRDAYSHALNLNASERGLENRSGKDLAKVLTDNQAALGRYEDGTLDASKAVPKLRETLAPLDAQAQEILTKPQGVVRNVSLPDVQTSVWKKIDGMTLPEVDKEDAKKLASSYLAAEAKKYGTDLSPAEADKIKQGLWAATFDKNRNNLQNHVPYLLGKEVQGAVEKSVAGTDTEAELHELNQRRGDLIDAIRRLEKMDGVKLLKGGRLGHMVSGTIGAIGGAASGLGPLGVLGGDYFGQKASQFLQNPATKISIARYRAKALGQVPGLVGRTSKPVGNAISKTGNAVKKSARVAGLVANQLTK